MTRRHLLALGLVLAARPAAAQTFTPQAATGLSVTFSSEKMGGSRVLVFGEVRNATNNTASRVTVLVEGLDETGKVVSRARAYVPSTVAARGGAPFEARLLASGSEKRYRATIESFEFVVGN
jgi:hypothetical protein